MGQEETTEQLSLFPLPDADDRPPTTVNWNLWHGCTRVSEGCRNCYMFSRDEAIGKDPGEVRRTRAFGLPVQRLRSGPYAGRYKIPPGSLIYTCFSSDFFHKDADEWRPAAWDMMRERSDCEFFMITKRPERIAENLPYDWGGGWEHVTIAVTCENRAAADRRLPVYLALPLRHKSVMTEPLLSAIDLEPFFRRFRAPDGRPEIELVALGGESGPNARPCDFSWVLDLRSQCAANGVAFSYHQTGARLIKDGKEYHIPRKLQHRQAKKAGIDLPCRSFIKDMPGE